MVRPDGVAWRTLFVTTIVVSTALSLTQVRLSLLYVCPQLSVLKLTLFSTALPLTQLIVIYRVNLKWGLSDFWFCLGDEVINATAGFIVQMPTLVMCAKLCPKGVESTVYALMTVVNNVAVTVSSTLSASLTSHYGITQTNFDNLGILTIITCLSSLLPVVFICLAPATTEGLDGLQERSALGGGLFLGGLATGLAFAILNAIDKLSHGHDGSGFNYTNVDAGKHRASFANATSVVHGQPGH